MADITIIGPQDSRPSEPGLCHDYHTQCEQWAKLGECVNNPGFMIHDGATCRKACRACKGCQPGAHVKCIHANRKAGGYLELNKEEFDRLGVPWWMGPEPSPEL